jgi:hypothetical protein
MVPEQFVDPPLLGRYPLAVDQAYLFAALCHGLPDEFTNHVVGLPRLEEMEVALIAEIYVAVVLLWHIISAYLFLNPRKNRPAPTRASIGQKIYLFFLLDDRDSL